MLTLEIKFSWCQMIFQTQTNWISDRLKLQLALIKILWKFFKEFSKLEEKDGSLAFYLKRSLKYSYYKIKKREQKIS